MRYTFSLRNIGSVRRVRLLVCMVAFVTAAGLSNLEQVAAQQPVLISAEPVALPVVTSALSDLNLEAGDSRRVDVSVYFSGEDLAYSATSSGGAASVSLSGSVLTVTASRKGSARVTVTASNPAGSASFDFGVTVTANVSEQVALPGVLSAMGRGILSSVSGTIGGRLTATAAERRFALARTDRRVDGITAGNALDYAFDDVPQGGLNIELDYTIWGAGDWNDFEGAPSATRSQDGTLASGYLGFDVARTGSWIAGLAVGRTLGASNYETSLTDGTLDATLNSAFPYVQWMVPGGRFEFWGIGGFGAGEVEADQATADLSMTLGMVGGRLQVAGSARGGLQLDLIGDAGVVRLSASNNLVPSLDGLEAAVHRARIGLEGARTTRLDNGTLITPFAQVAGRYDGGDGQTGNGLEVTGGLRIAGGRAELEARGRLLAVHAGEEVTGRGVSVVAYVRPVNAGGRGLSMALAPRIGAVTDMPGSIGALWRGDTMNGLARPSRSGTGMRAEIGYGLVHPAISGILVAPFGEVDVAGDDSRRVRVGARIGSTSGADGARAASGASTAAGVLSFELAGERIGGHGRTPDHRIGLVGRMSF